MPDLRALSLESRRGAAEHPLIAAGATVLPSQPELALLLACFKLAYFLEADDFRDALTDALCEAVGELQTRYLGVVGRRAPLLVPRVAAGRETGLRDTIDSYYFGNLEPRPPAGDSESPTTPASRQLSGSGFFLTDAAVDFLYKYSDTGSGIRRLIVDWGVLCLDHRGFDPHRKPTKADGEFLRELHARMRQFWVGGKEEEGGSLGDLGELEGLFGGAGVGCRYHGHGSGGGCYRKRYGT